jgi:hypothetical protein
MYSASEATVGGFSPKIQFEISHAKACFYWKSARAATIA